MSFALHRCGGITISVERKQRKYQKQIDNTIYKIVVEEAPNASETAQNKIRRLIERGCDSIILEQKRRLSKKGSA